MKSFLIAVLLAGVCRPAAADAWSDALAKLGLVYRGSRSYTVQGQAAFAQGTPEESRRLTAKADGVRLRLVSESAPDDAAAFRRLDDLRARFLAQFDGDIGYPGMVTHTLHVPDVLRPKELKSGPDRRDFIAPATARMTFGVGSPDLVSYTALVSLRVCAVQKRVVQVELFFTTAAFDASAAAAESAAFDCPQAAAPAIDLNQAFAAAQAASERGDDAQALARADDALALVEGRSGPDDPLTLGAVGRHAYFAGRAGRSELVKRDLERLLAVEPPSKKALVEAARLLRQAKRFHEALTLSRRAASLPPPDADSLKEEAEALVGLGRVPEAVVALSSAIAVSPKPYWLRMRLAEVYRMLGRFDDSLKTYEQARRESSSKAVRIDEAYARLAGGDVDGALGQFEQLAASSPTDPVLLHHWAEALSKAGRDRQAAEKFEQARALFRSAHRVDSDYFHTLHHLASLYISMGRRDEALGVTREALDALSGVDQPGWTANFVELASSLGEAPGGLEAAAQRELSRCGASRCTLLQRTGLTLALAQLDFSARRRAEAARLEDQVFALEQGFAPRGEGECSERLHQLLWLADLFEAAGRMGQAGRAYRSVQKAAACFWFPDQAAEFRMSYARFLRRRRAAGYAQAGSESAR